MARYAFHCLLLSWMLAPGAVRGEEPDTAPSPADERAAFRLADPALAIELAAAEPQVQSPVALAWDAAGALYVAEMRDYPDAAGGGSIKRLEDRDGDGIYEHATLFADGLPFPNGLAPHDGGLLVTAAPHLWFLRDTDGDGRADMRRVVLTGFGEGNQQLRVNGPTWGIDNHLYLANGRSGGLVRGPNDAEGQGVSIGRNDLRAQPGDWKAEAVAGFSQFGLPRDDWGNRFPSWNTVPFRHVVLETRDLAPLGPSAAGVECVADILDPADSRVFPIAPAPRTFNRESFAFFNATCGSTIFRGHALGETYRGNAFVCEPLTSLVHRRRLEPAGPSFHARRTEPDREFLASTHSWFRPVNLATGPDGALYVVDFCRALVEHPAFVPENLRSRVDFRKGHEHGRIWRIGPRDASASGPHNLATLQSAQLVALLEHENAWQRDTAQRLLVERQARETAPLLRERAQKAPLPLTRVLALWTLAGIGTRSHEHLIDQELIDALLRDPEPAVCEQALRVVAEPALALRAEVHADAIIALAAQRHPRVRLRALVLCARLREPARWGPVMASAAADPADPWMRRGVEIAVGTNLPEFLQASRRAPDSWLRAIDPPRTLLLSELGEIFGQAAPAAGDEGLAELLALLGEPGSLAPDDRPARLALLSGLVQGLARAGQQPAQLAQVNPAAFPGLLDEASAQARDLQALPAARALALRLLVELNDVAADRLLASAIQGDNPPELQAVAVQGALRRDNPALLAQLLAERAGQSAATRRALIGGLGRSARLARVLFDALEQGLVDAAEVDAALRQSLRSAPDAAIRERAARTFPAGSEPTRAAVLERYEQALHLQGDRARGERLFEEHCMKCHQRQGRGHRVGPDLASVAGRPKDELLASILDPNREVAPDQVSYLVLMRDGRIVDGLLAGETATAIRLRRAEGVEETVPRDQIEELRATGRSLMPEGLEESLTPQAVADLIECLRLQRP